MSIINSCKQRYATKKFDDNQSLSELQINDINEVLRLSPSSLNLQPWRFIGAKTPQEKERIARACPGVMGYNAKKIQQASYVVVLCAQQAVNEADIEKIIAKEEQDKRYLTKENKQDREKLLMGYLAKKKENPQQMTAWLEKQVYIALGGVLLATADMGIDSVAIEGFDVNILNEEFELKSKGIGSCVIVAFGMRSEGDFNAKLPKSRLEEDTLFLT